MVWLLAFLVVVLVVVVFLMALVVEWAPRIWQRDRRRGAGE